MAPAKKDGHTTLLSIKEGKEFDAWSATATSAEMLARLGTTMEGLGPLEIRKRHDRYGFNEAPKTREHSPLVKFLIKFKDPLVVVLIVIGAASLIMGQAISAFLVFFMAVASVALLFAQEQKAGNEAKKLSEMVSTTTTVIRGGKQHEVNMSMLVPGDIVSLSAGDMIPADLRILSAKDLFINQAALTGESFPVERSGEPQKGKVASMNDMTNIAFMGSDVVSGTAMGVVISTGGNTSSAR